MGLFGNKPSKKEARFMAPQWLKIIYECADHVNTTTNPEVVFSRYDLMLETLAKLADVERLVKLSGKKPSVQLKELVTIRERATNTFIDRSYQAARDGATNLKTEKGRVNAINNYFEKMGAYRGRMTPANLAHLSALQEQHQAEVV